MPEDELDLRSLPGVGDNVAQAVLCFGFGRRAVLLDVTTARLVERVLRPCRIDDAGSSGLTSISSPARPGPTRSSTTPFSITARWSAAPDGRAAMSAPSVERCAARGGAGVASAADSAGGVRGCRVEPTVIPSAARLMTSLRDIGYDLPSAVADLVDNSIDAGATTVAITVGSRGGTRSSASPMTVAG